MPFLHLFNDFLWIGIKPTSIQEVALQHISSGLSDFKRIIDTPSLFTSNKSDVKFPKFSPTVADVIVLKMWYGTQRQKIAEYLVKFEYADSCASILKTSQRIATVQRSLNNRFKTYALNRICPKSLMVFY